MRYKFITNIKKSLQSQIWKGSFQLPLKGRLETSLPCHVYAFTIVLLTLLVGCAHDENNIDTPDNPGFEEGIPTEVTITLSTRAANAQTRAEGDDPGTPKDPTKSVELIHDWWIAFVNEKKESVIIIKRDDEDVKDKVTSTSVNITGDGFEAETFRTIIPSGTYRIYTFANIPAKTVAEMKSMMGWNKEKTEYKLKNAYINTFITKAFNEDENSPNKGMQWFEKITNNEGTMVDNYLPMSGTFTQTIDNTVEASLNFEVVRAVAKVEFAFSNPSPDEITLKELKFGHISKGNNISIVPNYSAIGKAPNTDKLLTDIGDDKGILTFSNMGKTLAASKGEASHVFYCKESLGNWYDKDGVFLKKIGDEGVANKTKIDKEDVFKIELTVNRKKAGESTTSEETKTLYTSDIKYINRNDWIYIPININRWDIKWKLHYYPPIGGYPPVFEQNEDGSSLSATLTTGGEFELFPVGVTKNGNVTYTVDMNRDDMEVKVLDGSDDLFITEPHLVENPNVSEHPLSAFPKIIVGELDPKKTGTADIEITFYLTDDSGVTEAFKCTFHIHRQNSSPN